MSLTASAALRIGPLVLVTAIQHFLERHKNSRESDGRSKARDELLFDEAFTIAKAFMEAASRHTVGELQEFGNTRIPAPPTIRSVRLFVPISSCNEAATYIIEALGGPERAKDFVGGTRWWQVRGLEGVDANWVVAKKDIAAVRKARSASASGGFRSASLGAGLAQKEKEKSQHHASGSDERRETEEDGTYASEMDSMPCMYYLHGGGYYFGSVDQERYTMQRYARKMKGRVFAINYRLAPQYPFPCALQDALAGYLYLIRPPEGVHAPIHPSKIIIGGASAGGGLTLALLQVIRDTGLPLPAGGILISPWMDATHSFPSTFTNTATDIIPKYGLSLYRPSTLWPPPSEAVIGPVRAKFTSKLRSVVLAPAAPAAPHVARAAIEAELLPSESKNNDEQSKQENGVGKGADTATSTTTGTANTTTALGDTIPLSVQPLQNSDSAHTAGKKLTPTLSRLESDAKDAVKTSSPQSQPGEEPPPSSSEDTRKAPTSGVIPRERNEPIGLDIDGQEAVIRSQVQLYCMNHQLNHPLVSPALGYLGGLPPMFIQASDKEVLRDEIIFVAHKAAHPEKYPVKEETRELMPSLKGIEKKYGPTDVHLQVYDETCHILPAFSFTTPAKYLYRAIAGFCRHVTKDDINTVLTSSPPSSPKLAASPATGSSFPRSASLHPDSAGRTQPRSSSRISNLSILSDTSSVDDRPSDEPWSRCVAPPSTSTSGSPDVSDASAPESQPHDSDSKREQSTSSGPYVEPEFPSKSPAGIAGNPFVYIAPSPSAAKALDPDQGISQDSPSSQRPSPSPFVDHMIRERVSTSGVLRPLSPESTLAGCTLPPAKLGVISETAAKRYLEGQALWDKRYARAAKKVAKDREKHIRRSVRYTGKVLEKIAGRVERVRRRETMMESEKGVAEKAKDKTRKIGREVGIGNGNEELEEEQDPLWQLINSPLWTWGWALEGESPPPSSIAARGDTSQARKLAQSADIRLDEEESRLSGNNLWAVVLNALSAHTHLDHQDHQGAVKEKDTVPPNDRASESSTVPTLSSRESVRSEKNTVKRRRSIFHRIFRSRSESSLH